ncbi:trehalose-phosphatase [Erwinia sp. V71]|uniref:trehalose-phosphatase n=1 Tax=Erwinia sp. V71 TaxID=3369424 RepID=UPI003F634570
MSNDSEAFPALSGGLWAFFFDVDGTLATIQQRPEAVKIPQATREALQSLAQLSDGALALVSGRPVSQLDALIAPLRFPLAGVHGAERRDARGMLHQQALPAEVAHALATQLQQALAEWPGTHLENKGMAFALHYRQAPQYQQQVLQLAAELAERFPQLVQQPGKCVVELKPQGTDKGAAIRAFMQEAPFAGRTPVFIGDDLTDEAGFMAVNTMQGISVKVGAGSSAARYRLQAVEDVWQWLEQMTLQLEQDNVGKESRL